MPRLAVRLLGGFQVELDGEAVYAFRTDKARALLAYLMVESARPHRRETLAALLWPDRPDAVARANLRQALSYVRQALRDDGGSHDPPSHSQPHGPGPQERPPPFLLVTPTDVQFNAASDHTLDVAELEAFAAAPQWQLLPEPFCADFLAGMSVSDSEAFQAWVLDRQEYYHRLSMAILDEQVESFERSGNYEQAAAAARRQLRLEPWLEEAHQRCMRALALAGRRDEALHQYESCCRALAAELGVEPAAATTDLARDIRAGKIGPAGTRVSPSPRPRVLVSPRPRLVAREDELDRLGRRLDAALAGETAVAFVSGNAGSGKTALLEAFAASAMEEYPSLVVAGARCGPGGSADPCGPLRRLAEMLFGDLDSKVAWHPAGREAEGRLQEATGLALACLAENGPNLPGTLVPAASIARRAGSPSAASHGPLAQGPASQGATAQGPLPHGALSQGALSQGILFDQLLCTLAAIARERPLVLLLDDLHWVDDATAAFLLHLGRELTGSRLLVLGAYRPEQVEMSRRDPVTGEASRHPLATAIDELRRLQGEIVINLDRADGRAFVEAYVDIEPNRLGARFRDALYAQTGGHALFTVELLRNLQGRGELTKDDAGRWVAHESLDWGSLPARVEAAIAERIERLPEQAREVLSAASVQGDDFSAEVVAEVTGRPLAELIACLSGSLARQHALVKAEGAVRSAGLEHASLVPGASAEAPGSAEARTRSVYRFSHHLFQKYLYDALDPIERGRWHAAVAAGLERQVGGDPTERERLSAQLAWHYEAGGMPLQAARALHDAGRQAMRLSAFREALDAFDHGLALLAAEPPSPQRSEIQRLLETGRLVPQRSLNGWSGAKFESALSRGAEAGAEEAQGRSKLMVLQAEGERLSTKGHFEEGLAVAARILEEATQLGDEVFVALAHWRFGFIYNVMGQPQDAERHFEWILAWLTSERRAALRAAVGFDLTAHALTFSALDQWSLGYPEKALARSTEAVTGALERGDLYGQAFASAVGSITLFLLRNAAAVQERSEQCQRLCQQKGFAMWQLYSDTFLGWLAVVRGDPAAIAGIERMRGAIVGWQAKGMTIGTDSLVLVLADGCLAAVRRCSPGDEAQCTNLLVGALEAIDTVLGPNVPCGQSYQAELHRVRGELLLERDGLAAAGEALECFKTALTLAGEHGLRGPELRAAMSLVRLRERQGDGCVAELAEARNRLAEVYGRFTEGFAFADLTEAATLMGETKRKTPTG